MEPRFGRCDGNGKARRGPLAEESRGRHPPHGSEHAPTTNAGKAAIRPFRRSPLGRMSSPQFAIRPFVRPNHASMLARSASGSVTNPSLDAREKNDSARTSEISDRVRPGFSLS